MKFEIKNRWTGSVIFSAEGDPPPNWDATLPIRVREVLE